MNHFSAIQTEIPCWNMLQLHHAGVLQPPNLEKAFYFKQALILNGQKIMNHIFESFKK